jgi:hypothetical protein
MGAQELTREERTRLATTRHLRALLHLANRPVPHVDDDVGGTVKLPVNLSNRARGVLGWMLVLMDDEGCVLAEDLRDVLGLSSRPGDPTAALRSTLRDLEAFGLARRIRRSSPLRIRVALSKVVVDGWTTCMHCPRPVVVGTHASHYCAPCMATLVRHDRTWRAHAFEVWAAQNPGESEAKVIYKIHAQTNQPLFSRKLDPDTVKEGIVNWMLSAGMIVNEPFWRGRVRAFAAGEDGEA